MEKTEHLFTDEQMILDGLRTIKSAAGGLERKLQSLQQSLHSIFNGFTLAQYLLEALQASGKLDKELLVMRLALGKLRVAIGDAFAPIGQVVIPVINDAIFAAIRFVRSAGRIIHALFGVSDSASDAADAEDAYASSISSASKAAQRSLASFDKLNRLQQQTGGSGSSSSTSSRDENYSMNLEEYLIFNTISNMLKPLKEIDLTPLIRSLEDLKAALAPIDRHLFEGLRWAWDEIFVPIIQWSAEILLPEIVDSLRVALQALNRVIEACKPALTFLWENFFKPLGQWTAQYLLDQLERFQNRLNGIAAWTEAFPPSANQVLEWIDYFSGGLLSASGLMDRFTAITNSSQSSISKFSNGLWNSVLPFGAISDAVSSLKDRLNGTLDIWGEMNTSSKDTSNELKTAWGGMGGWFGERVFAVLHSGFRTAGNGILVAIKGVTTGTATAFNTMIAACNKLKFTAPSWLPDIGGAKFQITMPMVQVPKIPMLAQGAVLPANKPFLAMVGDQRYGTNIEAPLTTIQEAVRMELQDMIDSNLAGQETIAGVLRQILEAVLGISITEENIAQAADRYRSKMAVVRGNLL